MKRFTFSLFIILSFYTGAYYCFIYCANCKDVANYTECFEELAKCQGTQYCKFERKTVGNQTLYTLGCDEQDECQVKSTTLPAEKTLSAVTLGSSRTPAMTTTSTTSTFTSVTSAENLVNLTTTDNDTTTTRPSETSTLYTTTTQIPATSMFSTIPAERPSTKMSLNTTTQPSTTSTHKTTSNHRQTTTTPYTTTAMWSASPIGKRYLPQMMSEDLDDVISQTDDHCLECCQGTMCNIDTLACVPGLCYDKLGKKSCDTAKESFNVCNNITFAKNMCRATCGLCALVDGNWASWSAWTVCSVSCGNGTHTRERNCTDPAPENKGENCTGDPTEETECKMEECPTDGNWGPWNGWSECSRTCGVGLRFKDRTCSHPAPDQNGLFCQGEPRDYEVCMNGTCEGDGHWQLWSDWSECSDTCGLGHRSRLRNCSVPEVFGPVCFGDSHEKDLCNFTDCKNGQWMAWSGWSACSSTCGVGLKTRSRDCGGLLGHSCPGPNTESDLCYTSQCDDAMSAFATTGVPAPGKRNATLKFTLVRTNVGHDYDNETGVYTCRISGLYQFFVSIEKQTNVSQAYCHLMVNNSSTILIAARSAFTHADAFQQASNSMVLDLKTGDEVFLGRCSDPSTMTNEGVFSGSLISKH